MKNYVRHRAQRRGVKEDKPRQAGVCTYTGLPVQLFQYLVREENCRTGHNSSTEHRAVRHDPQGARGL